MNQRIELIKRWVEYSPPDKKIIEQLKKFGWDYLEKPFEMKSDHVRSILDRYKSNKLTKDEVYEWADFLEMREDVNYQKFKDIIFCLANPEINEELSSQLADKFIQKLKEQP